VAYLMHTTYVSLCCSTVDAAGINRGNWESFQGKMVNLKSSNEEYYEDINYTADKWDVEVPPSPMMPLQY